MFCGSTLVLHDGNAHHWQDPTVDGKGTRRGLVPRNYQTHPVGCYRSIKPYTAVDLKPFPESEWRERLNALRAGGALLGQIRRRGNPGTGKPIPSRDQNGRGYCWQHSGVSAMLLCRARDGQPYADLSAYGPSCREKNFRDEGGWGAQGVQNLIEWGCPTSKTWPQQGTSRSYDNAESRAEALLYRVDEGWIDLQAAEYDRNLAWSQYVTCWLCGDPTIDDHNWWSHSICGEEPVEGASIFNECRDEWSGKLVTLQEFEIVWDMNDPVTAGWGCKIWNSWGDSWSDQGEGILPPQKAVPDGGVALRTVTAA